MNFTLAERVIHKMEKVSKDIINQKKSEDYIAGFNSVLRLVKWFKKKSDDKFEKEARELFIISDREIQRNNGLYEMLYKGGRS